MAKMKFSPDTCTLSGHVRSNTLVSTDAQGRPVATRPSPLGRGLHARSPLDQMSWKCTICSSEHVELPTCFGIEAPWRALVPEVEFSKRVDLTSDQCVVDAREFFVRGHIEIPIVGRAESLAFS